MFPLYMSPPANVSTFSFNNPPTSEIYTLSLHDALPIWRDPLPGEQGHRPALPGPGSTPPGDGAGGGRPGAGCDGALDRALRAFGPAQTLSARVPAGPPAPGVQPVQQDLR